MVAEPDFVEYHRSIAHELEATKNRVRNLIQDSHWSTEGGYKEVLLRKVLESRLPEYLHVGWGFVCYGDGASTQLDVLITDKRKPTLFQQGDLVIVTPDCVEAIIEVKTGQQSLAPAKSKGGSEGGLGETISKLVEQAQKVRESAPRKKCWAGLLVYDDPPGLSHKPYEEKLYGDKAEAILERVFEAYAGDKAKIVSCVAFGPQMFIRYWSKAIVGVGAPGWSCYAFNQPQMGNTVGQARLAPAYFVSNLVWDVSTGLADSVKYAWFPVDKEDYRVGYITLDGRNFQRRNE